MAFQAEGPRDFLHILRKKLWFMDYHLVDQIFACHDMIHSLDIPWISHDEHLFTSRAISSRLLLPVLTKYLAKSAQHCKLVTTVLHRKCLHIRSTQAPESLLHLLYLLLTLAGYLISMSDSQSTPRPRATTFSRANPRVDVIFNCVSGNRDPDDDLHIIRSTLEKSFEEVKVWSTTPEKGGETLGREALDSGAHLLVASGGDGTIAGVACAMKKKGVEEGEDPPLLGVVPRGTANALCAALDIPTDIKKAAEMIGTGSVRRIDFPSVIHDDESVPTSMMLLCGVGLEAETVKRADRGMKKILGTGAYALAGLTSTWTQGSFRTDLVLYGVNDSLMFAGGKAECEKLHLTGLNLKGVTIANAAPATSVLAQGIGKVTPDDGLLEVVCIAESSPIGMIGLMLSMLKSALLRTRQKRGNVYGLRARKVEVVCDPPQMIVLDGEEAGQTPVTISVDSGADQVNIIAPKAGTVNRRRRRVSRSLIRLWRNVRGVSILAATVAIVGTMRRKQLGD